MKEQEAKSFVESIDLAKYNLEKGDLDYTNIAQIVGDYTNHPYAVSGNIVPEIEVEVLLLEHLVEAVYPQDAADARKIGKAFDILRDSQLLTDKEIDKAIVIIMMYLRHIDIMYFDEEEQKFQEILCNILIEQKHSFWR